MKLSKALLSVGAVIFAAIGVLYAVRPDLIVPLSENPNATSDARTEIRAVYGGIELGIGIFFAMCARRDDMRIAGLWALTLMSGLAGVVRYSSFFFEGVLESTHLAFGASELLGGVLGLVALRNERKRT